MYRIGIVVEKEADLLLLKTANRARARAVLLLCNENEVECVVDKEAKVVPVKFKGVD